MYKIGLVYKRMDIRKEQVVQEMKLALDSSIDKYQRELAHVN